MQDAIPYEKFKHSILPLLFAKGCYYLHAVLFPNSHLKQKRSPLICQGITSLFWSSILRHLF